MRQDPQIRAILNAYFLPVIRAQWSIDPAGCKDEVAKFVADNLGLPILGQEVEPGPARRKGVLWQRHLRQALPYMIFGHMPFELRYAPGDGGRMQLDNLGQRMPWTIAQMKIGDDGILQQIEQTTQRTPIPASRLIWYAHEMEGSNWAGISMLRPLFGAWLLKHETWRVHATSIRRFGMGVPTVTAPQGATQQMIQQAQQMAASMRAGDSAGMAVPAGFTAEIKGIAGSTPDALGFINYLDQSMAKMALAQMIELGQTRTGSRALGESFMDLFLLSLQALADDVAEVATRGHPGLPGIVTNLVDVNWGEDEPAPKIVCNDVGQDYDLTASAIGTLIQQGALVADKPLENWIRDRWKLPKADPNDQLPPPAKGGGPGGGGAPPEGGPPGGGGGGGGTPTPNPFDASSARSGTERPTRVQAAYLEASKFNAAAHQADWEQALASLLMQYRAVLSQQRTDIVDRVVTAIEAGRPQDFSFVPPGSAEGADMITVAMERTMRRAAQQLISEAAEQGVVIDMEHVRFDTEQMQRSAQARAGVTANYMAVQAGTKALQVYDASPKGFLDAANEVAAFLDGLSDRQVKDQLGAALTAAQNAGRIAVLKAAPESAGTAKYVAAEWLDKNTCDKCRAIDGYQFPSLEQAEQAYPTGGYKDCEGLMRCRGTVVPVWGANVNMPRYDTSPPRLMLGSAGVAAKFDPLEKRGEHGKWTSGGEVRKLLNPETGRVRAQTPSQFTHPFTGHKMGKTEIGDTFEELFKRKGAKLLEDRYGGPFTRVSGEGGMRNTPLDFMLDHKRGGELKTLNVRAESQKTAIKKAEVDRKVAAAKDAGVEPLLAVQVIDPETGRAEVYAWPAFASKRVSAMEHVGGYNFGPEDFQAAQEVTGHWQQAEKRAQQQGVAAASDSPPDDPEPAPGDTVIELRDGVPYIFTQPGVAAKFNPDEPRDKHGHWIHLGDLVDFLDDKKSGKGTLEHVDKNGIATIRTGNGKLEHVHVDSTVRIRGQLPSDTGKGGAKLPPEPEPPKPEPKPGTGWTAKGADYHHATLGGSDYTLHYAKGGGWDVHTGHAEKPKELGPKIGHGKNAKEAKALAEKHAETAGRAPKPEPIGRGNKPKGPEPGPKPAGAEPGLAKLAAKHGFKVSTQTSTTSDGKTYTTTRLIDPSKSGLDARVLTHDSAHDDYRVSTGQVIDKAAADRYLAVYKEHPDWSAQSLLDEAAKPEPKKFKPGEEVTFPSAIKAAVHLRAQGGDPKAVYDASDAPGLPVIVKGADGKPTGMTITMAKDGSGFTVKHGVKPKETPSRTREFTSFEDAANHLKANGGRGKVALDSMASPGVPHPVPDSSGKDTGMRVTYTSHQGNQKWVITHGKPAQPEPGKAPEPAKWSAYGANYHHARIGDQSYTLHYASGGGWDVHLGHAASTKTLGDKIGHGKNASEAKAIAEKHAADEAKGVSTEVPPVNLSSYSPGDRVPIPGIPAGIEVRRQGYGLSIDDAKGNRIANVQHYGEGDFRYSINNSESGGRGSTPEQAVQRALATIERNKPVNQDPVKLRQKLSAPPASRLGPWFTKAAPALKAAAAKVYGDAEHRWNGQTFTQKNDRWLGVMTWGGQIGLAPEVAERAAKVIHPDASVKAQDIKSIEVLWHEIHHSVGSGRGDLMLRDANDYQTDAGHHIEEGYTELGGWMTLGDFLGALGVKDRPTNEVLSGKRGSIAADMKVMMKPGNWGPERDLQAINNIRDRRAVDARGQLIAARNALNDPNDPKAVTEVERAIAALETLGLTDRANRLKNKLSAMQYAPPAKAMTLGDWTDKHVEPGLFLGTSEKSKQVTYKPHVQNAYRWLENVAALELEQKGKRVPAGGAPFGRVKELSIEVNRESGPAKRTAMATQYLRALGVPASDMTKWVHNDGRPRSQNQDVTEHFADQIRQLWGRGDLQSELLRHAKLLQNNGIISKTVRLPDAD